ncbi:MAG TPA: oligosaccharide flippase family protein, partial [Anaeromyxobacteraceae bacterium]|nr:oligosaccharide flippase family protein [Anaeromyxobacteraceae bacterium]
MSFGKGLLAGLANSIWGTLVALAVVPVYVRYLGVEAYGLIGFFATTQAVLQILDLGLAPTVNREVARCRVAGEPDRARTLVHTLAAAYWATAGLLAAGSLFVGPVVARHWLRAGALPQETVAAAVTLIGIVIACRWPTNIYLGALMGAERLVEASWLGIAATTASSLGAVAILAFVSSSLQGFFLWQAAVGLAYALASRWAAWRVLGRPRRVRAEGSVLRGVVRFSAGMSAIAVLGLLSTQLDKLLLSRLLSLQDLGRYTLAAMVAGSLSVVIAPVFNGLFPRFSALAATGDTAGLAALYRTSARLLGGALFPIVVFLHSGGEGFLRLWLSEPDLARAVAPVAVLLAAGTALHGVMYVPYALLLAFGRTRLALAQAAIFLATLAPLMIVGSLRGGMRGGALAWLVAQALYVLYGTWITHRHLLTGMGWGWLARDVGIPLTLSLGVGAAGGALLRATVASPASSVVTAAGLAAIASAL